MAKPVTLQPTHGKQIRLKRHNRFGRSADICQVTMTKKKKTFQDNPLKYLLLPPLFRWAYASSRRLICQIHTANERQSRIWAKVCLSHHPCVLPSISFNVICSSSHYDDNIISTTSQVKKLRLFLKWVSPLEHSSIFPHCLVEVFLIYKSRLLT